MKNKRDLKARWQRGDTESSSSLRRRVLFGLFAGLAFGVSGLMMLRFNDTSGRSPSILLLPAFMGAGLVGALVYHNSVHWGTKGRLRHAAWCVLMGSAIGTTFVGTQLLDPTMRRADELGSMLFVWLVWCVSASIGFYFVDRHLKSLWKSD